MTFRALLVRRIASAAALAIMPHVAFAQGSLTPPGPPGPTMKTLSELEAKLEKRTPISSLPFTISAPGSYYLTGNLTGKSGQSGITISVDDVTLDLNGYALTGVGGSRNGIEAPIAGRRNLAISNGAVRNWGQNGIDVLKATNSTVQRIRASGNGLASPQAGISIGAHCALMDCRLEGNFIGANVGNASVVANVTADTNQSVGIKGGSDLSISSCSAADNVGSGFSVQTGCTITGCTAARNGDCGFNATDGCLVSKSVAFFNVKYGVFVDQGSTVSECVVRASSDVTAGIGIRVGDYSTVTGCNASENKGDGIQTTSQCLLLNNSASHNGTSSLQALHDGIHLFGGGNRVDGNITKANGRAGIESNDPDNGNVIVRNVAGQNSFDYKPSTGTEVGPLQSASTATSPWANF